MPIILAIESSCDETSAAVLRDGVLLSNIVTSQVEHSRYGGVIPELASRLHQEHVVAVIQQALEASECQMKDLDAVAVTQGPGLLGALLVGVNVAKGIAMALDIPLIGIDHMKAHILANLTLNPPPAFPFICLTVSGGHTQLVLVHSHDDQEILGETLDDAAGEAFDKAAKLLGLPYPGGPVIDRMAAQGKPERFPFPIPETQPYEFSFSGLKTSLLYLLRKETAQNPNFIEEHKADLCASFQHRVVQVLLAKLKNAMRNTGVRTACLAGGVSSNSALRAGFLHLCQKQGWSGHIPPFALCTDNAGMIAVAASYAFERGKFAPLDMVPYARG